MDITKANCNTTMYILQIKSALVHVRSSFFHPDYTVGTGFSPVHAIAARGLCNL